MAMAASFPAQQGRNDACEARGGGGGAGRGGGGVERRGDGAVAGGDALGRVWPNVVGPLMIGGAGAGGVLMAEAQQRHQQRSGGVVDHSTYPVTEEEERLLNAFASYLSSAVSADERTGKLATPLMQSSAEKLKAIVAASAAATPRDGEDMDDEHRQAAEAADDENDDSGGAVHQRAGAGGPPSSSLLMSPSHSSTSAPAARPCCTVPCLDLRRKNSSPGTGTETSSLFGTRCQQQQRQHHLQTAGAPATSKPVLEDAAATNLGNPMELTREELSVLPLRLLWNLNKSFGTLIDSRIRSYVTALERQQHIAAVASAASMTSPTMSASSCSSAATKAKITRTIIRLLVSPASGGGQQQQQQHRHAAQMTTAPAAAAPSTVVTTFRTLPYSERTHTGEVVIPLILEAVIDLRMFGNIVDVHIEAPGTIQGRFQRAETAATAANGRHPHNHPLELQLSHVEISLDSSSLLQSMMSQARTAARKAIAYATDVAALATGTHLRSPVVPPHSPTPSHPSHHQAHLQQHQQDQAHLRERHRQHHLHRVVTSQYHVATPAIAATDSGSAVAGDHRRGCSNPGQQQHEYQQQQGQQNQQHDSSTTTTKVKTPTLTSVPESTCSSSSASQSDRHREGCSKSPGASPQGAATVPNIPDILWRNMHDRTRQNRKASDNGGGGCGVQGGSSNSSHTSLSSLFSTPPMSTSAGVTGTARALAPAPAAENPLMLPPPARVPSYAGSLSSGGTSGFLAAAPAAENPLSGMKNSSFDNRDSNRNDNARVVAAASSPPRSAVVTEPSGLSLLTEAASGLGEGRGGDGDGEKKRKVMDGGDSGKEGGGGGPIAHASTPLKKRLRHGSLAMLSRVKREETDSTGTAVTTAASALPLTFASFGGHDRSPLPPSVATSLLLSSSSLGRGGGHNPAVDTNNAGGATRTTAADQQGDGDLNKTAEV